MRYPTYIRHLNHKTVATGRITFFPWPFFSFRILEERFPGSMVDRYFKRKQVHFFLNYNYVTFKLFAERRWT